MRRKGARATAAAPVFGVPPAVASLVEALNSYVRSRSGGHTYRENQRRERCVCYSLSSSSREPPLTDLSCSQLAAVTDDLRALLLDRSPTNLDRKTRYG